ncbi:hypothetical protein JCM8097_000459 [Rhodosporidiobolus ruineniae]
MASPTLAPSTATVLPSLAPLSPSICSRVDCISIFLPILLGVLLSCAGLGMVLVASLRYLVLFPDARFRNRRIMVLVVLAVQIVQTSMDVTRVLKIYGLHYGDVFYFLKPRWEDALAPFFAVLLQLQTQFFLLARAYSYATVARMRGAVKWAATAGLAVLVVASGAGGMIVSLEIKLLNSLARLSPGDPQAKLLNIAAPAWLISSAFIDCTLAFIVTHELFSARRAANGLASLSSQRTKDVLKRLVRVVLRSGIVLALAQTATAVTWFTEAHTAHGRLSSSWVYLPIIVLPKIYTLTYLAILLAPRRNLRESLTSESTLALTGPMAVPNLPPLGAMGVGTRSAEDGDWEYVDRPVYGYARRAGEGDGGGGEMRRRYQLFPLASHPPHPYQQYHGGEAFYDPALSAYYHPSSHAYSYPGYPARPGAPTPLLATRQRGYPLSLSVSTTHLPPSPVSPFHPHSAGGAFEYAEDLDEAEERLMVEDSLVETTVGSGSVAGTGEARSAVGVRRAEEGGAMGTAPGRFEWVVYPRPHPYARAPVSPATAIDGTLVPASHLPPTPPHSPPSGQDQFVYVPSSSVRPSASPSSPTSAGSTLGPPPNQPGPLLGSYRGRMHLPHPPLSTVEEGETPSPPAESARSARESWVAVPAADPAALPPNEPVDHAGYTFPLPSPSLLPYAPTSPLVVVPPLAVQAPPVSPRLAERRGAVDLLPAVPGKAGLRMEEDPGEEVVEAVAMRRGSGKERADRGGEAEKEGAESRIGTTPLSPLPSPARPAFAAKSHFSTPSSSTAASLPPISPPQQASASPSLRSRRSQPPPGVRPLNLPPPVSAPFRPKLPRDVPLDHAAEDAEDDPEEPTLESVLRALKAHAPVGPPSPSLPSPSLTSPRPAPLPPTHPPPKSPLRRPFPRPVQPPPPPPLSPGKTAKSRFSLGGSSAGSSTLTALPVPRFRRQRSSLSLMTKASSGSSGGGSGAEGSFGCRDARRVELEGRKREGEEKVEVEFGTRSGSGESGSGSSGVERGIAAW